MFPALVVTMLAGGVDVSNPPPAGGCILNNLDFITVKIAQTWEGELLQSSCLKNFELDRKSS